MAQFMWGRSTLEIQLSRYDIFRPLARKSLKRNSKNRTRFNWTFMDAVLSLLLSPFFLPFKMNDWRFFNVSQNQFLLCLVSIILTVAAKKTSKEIFVFIN